MSSPVSHAGSAAPQIPACTVPSALHCPHEAGYASPLRCPSPSPQRWRLLLAGSDAAGDRYRVLEQSRFSGSTPPWEPPHVAGLPPRAARVPLTLSRALIAFDISLHTLFHGTHTYAWALGMAGQIGFTAATPSI